MRNLLDKVIKLLEEINANIKVLIEALNKKEHEDHVPTAAIPGNKGYNNDSARKRK